MSDPNKSTPTLLLVEDNDDDVFLMRRALKKSGLVFSMQVVLDGQQAMDYLGGVGQYNDRAQYPVPSIVFLDLKLPYVHGFEVLAWIREQPLLRELPVIVLTSSPEDRDRQRARELRAQAYLVKPPTGEMLLQALETVKDPLLANS